jgi:hypothetical protein
MNMKKKIIGIGLCLLLFGLLLPLTSAEQVAPVSMSKTIFIGRFTLLSHQQSLVNKNIVGWVIGGGEIHRYRGPLPDVTGNIQGIISSPFVMLVFQTNPFY